MGHRGGQQTSTGMRGYGEQHLAEKYSLGWQEGLVWKSECEKWNLVAWHNQGGQELQQMRSCSEQDLARIHDDGEKQGLVQYPGDGRAEPGVGALQ